METKVLLSCLDPDALCGQTSPTSSIGDTYIIDSKRENMYIFGIIIYWEKFTWTFVFHDSDHNDCTSIPENMAIWLCPRYVTDKQWLIGWQKMRVGDIVI